MLRKNQSANTNHLQERCWQGTESKKYRKTGHKDSSPLSGEKRRGIYHTQTENRPRDRAEVVGQTSCEGQPVKEALGMEVWAMQRWGTQVLFLHHRLPTVGVCSLPGGHTVTWEHPAGLSASSEKVPSRRRGEAHKLCQ